MTREEQFKEYMREVLAEAHRTMGTVGSFEELAESAADHFDVPLRQQYWEVWEPPQEVYDWALEVWEAWCDQA